LSASPIECVLASGNQGKLLELSDALINHGITLSAQTKFNIPEAIEDAPTFIENSLKKARHASRLTGLPALADDSGLVVPALRGDPGIRSARYAALQDDQKPTDQDNIDKLLQTLKPLNDDAREAYFVCVLVLLRRADDPEPLVATGRWYGQILKTPQGDAGFGYDPVFYCPQQEMSAATMGKEKKRTISHRAIALELLKKQLAQSQHFK